MNDQATEPATAPARHPIGDELACPGAITYLHMPATDVGRCAAFYRDVFGWSVGEGDHPSFQDAGGRMHGAWLRADDCAGEPRLLAYVYVDDVDAAVTRIVAHGGRIDTTPYPEGKLVVATFRDPEGTAVGLWHDSTRAPDGTHASDSTHPSDTTRAPDGTHASDSTHPSDGTRAPGGVAAPSSTADRPHVAPVPEHLHTVTPRLLIAGAAAAIDFYVEAFGARELGERHHLPDGTLVHAELEIGDSVVMVAEDPEVDPATGEGGYHALLCTYWPDVDAAWERAVAAGARVLHPLADRDYGERGGRLADRFGQEWMLGARIARA